MNPKILKLYVQNNLWICRDDSPFVYELFGTSDLPTPYGAKMTFETVKAKLQVRNPESQIIEL